MLSKLRSELVPTLVIVAAPLILCAPLVFYGRVLYWGTPLLQFYEWRQLVVDALRGGHFPLWTGAVGNGFPLLANLQSAVLYPLNALFLVFPVERAMGYSVVLHLILAGVFMYGYARYIGLGRLPGVVSALSYSLSAFMVSRAQFLSMVSCAAWLPLLFWLGDRVLDRRRIADALLLGLVIALQIFAGHAQLWYYGLWVLALYALWRGLPPIISSRRGTPSARGGPLTAWALLCVAVAVGVLAAAAQLLPTAELAHWSQRASGVSYDFAMNYSFWPWRLITLFAPDFFGSPAVGDFWGRGNYWEDAGYIGLLPLMLAVAAVVVWVRRRKSAGTVLSRAPFFAALGLVALLLALGQNLPVYPFVFRHVPGFGLFQAPARFLYWYTFAAALLAGIGLQHLGESPTWVRASRYLTAFAVSVLGVVLLARLLLPVLPQPSFAFSLTRFAVLGVLSAVVVLFRTHGWARRRPGAWSVWIALLLLADLWTFGAFLNPTAEAGLYRAPSAVGDFVRAQTAAGAPFRIASSHRYTYETMFDSVRGLFRFRDFGPSDEVRIRTLRESLLPNLNVIEGLDSANNYDPLPVGLAQDLLDRADMLSPEQASRLLALMNVRYVVDNAPLAGLQPVYAAQTKIYQLPGYLPRAYGVFQAKVVPDDAAQLTALLASDFDPNSEVILASAGPLEQGGSAEKSMPAVTLLYGPNRVTMDAVFPQPGYLVLLDTYYPDWVATVDGRAQPVLRANYAFRAVALPAGRHRVEFSYQPLSFRVGIWISAATWLVAALAWVILSRWKHSS